MLERLLRQSVVAFVQSAVLIVCCAANTMAQSQDELERNKDLVVRTLAALDAGELDKLDQLMTEDFTRHCQATPDAVVESLDDFKVLLGVWAETFSDVVSKVDVLVAEGDRVAFCGTYTATHTGPMGSFPATGKQMSCEFAGYHRIAGGKIAETWVTWDNLAILGQLGIFPPPDPASSD